ncbi:MAG: phosphoenolpyruvate carboxykinase (GTP) [Chthoniobacteraceae bacterium]
MSTFGTTKPTNQAVLDFVKETAELTTPDQIFWVDGSEAEKDYLYDLAVKEGLLIKLNQEKRPGCYYGRSNPNDVARVEQLTFICTPRKEEVGPLNNWKAPEDMHSILNGLLKGCMKGRTLYVIPYLMGPAGSPLTKVGIEITDSIMVVLNMRIMARCGAVAYGHLGDSNDFNRGTHSMLDINPERRYISHFPHENAIYSVGSNYGGNVLLGKKCLALRIGSFLGRNEGWMAEHMLLLCIESPEGKKNYVAAAFPSACGKTNFAMMIPPEKYQKAGWKITTLGDDIAWMRPGPDGRLYAINPENGYFGVAPGTNYKSNPNAMHSASKDTIFTNVALTEDLDVWWEGMDGEVPQKLTDWKGNPWTPESKEKAAHPNSRFTAPMRNNPALSDEVEAVSGVPIDAIIFGGRRATTMPLVMEAFSWSHGVYIGASMGSEMTAAAVGGMGQVRRDPMAMLPFAGYDMGEYFGHWLEMGKVLKNPPMIFNVNWFRKDSEGHFMWPGFGDNMRVLLWIIGRCNGTAKAIQSAVGRLPLAEDIDIEGLKDFGPEKLAECLKVCKDEWKNELTLQTELFLKLYKTLPKELVFERELLAARLS